MTKYKIINSEPIEITPDPDQTPGIMDTLQPGEIPVEPVEPPEEIIEPEPEGNLLRKKLEDKTAEKKYEERREQLKGLRQDNVLREQLEEKRRREQLEEEQQEKELTLEHGKIRPIEIAEPKTEEERARLAGLQDDVKKIIISEGLREEDEIDRPEKEDEGLIDGDPLEDEGEEGLLEGDKDSPEGPNEPPKKRRRRRQG